MTATQVNILQITLALLMMICSAYAGGRVHQWYRHSMERDAAFREGYNHASESLFPLAARSMHQKADALGVEAASLAAWPDASPSLDDKRTTHLLHLYGGRHSAS